MSQFITYNLYILIEVNDPFVKIQAKNVVRSSTQLSNAYRTLVILRLKIIFPTKVQRVIRHLVG
jgi:hypothetical protein